MDFISMTETSRLAEKTIGRLNATWNSAKKRVLQVPSRCLRDIRRLCTCALSRDVNRHCMRMRSFYKQAFRKSVADWPGGLVV